MDGYGSVLASAAAPAPARRGPHERNLYESSLRHARRLYRHHRDHQRRDCHAGCRAQGYIVTSVSHRAGQPFVVHDHSSALRRDDGRCCHHRESGHRFHNRPVGRMGELGHVHRHDRLHRVRSTFLPRHAPEVRHPIGAGSVQVHVRRTLPRRHARHHRGGVLLPVFVAAPFGCGAHRTDDWIRRDTARLDCFRSVHRHYTAWRHEGPCRHEHRPHGGDVRRAHCGHDGKSRYGGRLDRTV